MAKFIYKMQNILDLKEKMEEQAKNEYTKAKGKADEENEKLEGIVQKKQEYEKKLQNLMVNRLVLADIRQSLHAIKTLEYKIEEQKVAVLRANKAVEIAKGKMNNAMVERKTQEKLKDNAFGIFKKELIAIENKENDELVSFKYNKCSEEV